MKLRIKDVAKRKGLTMKHIAEQCGFLGVAISRYNAGVIDPPFERLEKIAQVLDCEVVELLPVGEKFYHSYGANGEWMGIVKKSSS